MAESKLTIADDLEDAAPKTRATAEEFEQMIGSAKIKISAVSDAQKILIPIMYPGSIVGPGVTHTWTETGPQGRGRLHLLELPALAGTSPVVRLLDVIKREDLMIPPPGQFV